ncbi:MAG: alpha/beta hydrolase-fold protein [bacterium]|nr:alpha/beta hydrolase-fold protein [bacterium]
MPATDRRSCAFPRFAPGLAFAGILAVGPSISAQSESTQSESAQSDHPARSPGEAIDAFLDARHDGALHAGGERVDALLAELRELGVVTPAELETALRAPRHEYPSAEALVGRTTTHEVECYHVDYATRYFLFVPKGYRADRAAPLVFVAHGGNSSMSPGRAGRVAQAYLRAYAPAMAKHLRAIVVAPASSRGWGQIGNSIALSVISDLQRRLHIDPDRIYVTGQSMGGHMAFRSALTIGDRFAAVSPQSGGYDFVAKRSIANLLAVPGYVTWGKREPYGIDKDSRTNAAWAKEHELDWVFVEKDGGHEIYADELPKVARFFADHPRDPRPARVYIRAGGAMKFTRTWGIKGWPEHEVRHEDRPLRWNLRHWLELTPRPDHKGALTADARYAGDNRFEITTDQVRELAVYLHPDMIDFASPVRIVVNGTERFAGKVAPDPRLMLALVREFDDRGRIWWARVRVEVPDDRPDPFGF